MHHEMEWAPNPGERTQWCVYGNEGHSLPRDAGVSRKGLTGGGQTSPQADQPEQHVTEFSYGVERRRHDNIIKSLNYRNVSQF